MWRSARAGNAVKVAHRMLSLRGEQGPAKGEPLPDPESPGKHFTSVQIQNQMSQHQARFRLQRYRDRQSDREGTVPYVQLC